METGPGVELPQRTGVMWLLVAVAAVFLVPSVRMVRKALGETETSTQLLGWGMTTAVVLVMVVLPLLMARSMHQRHTFVSDDAVTTTKGDSVRQRIRFDDLEQVRVRYDGNMGGATLQWINEAVVLVGADDRGRQRQVPVSRIFVTTLQPLLRRLEQEVARRPDLLADRHERQLFESALAQAD